MKFLDLSLQYQSIRPEIDAVIKRVLENSVFIGGEEVEKFEKEVADFCGVKFAIPLNSGTDALFLTLKAKNIGPGDEVITTPFTFIATAEVIANLRAKPVFVDIDPKTFNIDVSKIEKAIGPKTKTILPVHLFGQMADIDAVLSLAKKYNLSVIEDVAQAIGASFRGKMAGSFGDAGCLSFFPSKNLGAMGDGGMVITNDENLAETIRLLKNHGSSPKEKYYNLVLGVNSRLDALQAAILRVKLKYLPEWSKKRAEKAEFYTNQLGDNENIVSPKTSEGKTHIFHQYTIRVKQGKRQELADFLKTEGVPTMIYYPLPLHLQPAFKYLGYKEGDFPEAEKAAKEVLSLPIFPELLESEQRIVVEKIKKFQNSSK